MKYSRCGNDKEKMDEIIGFFFLHHYIYYDIYSQLATFSALYAANRRNANSLRHPRGQYRNMFAIDDTAG